MAPMATSSTKNNALALLLLVLLPLMSTLASRSGPAAQHHGHAGHGPKPHHPSSSLVRSTCNSTAYYDLCVSALGADPSSATADVRGLSAIAVSAAAANASGGAATAAALANGTSAPSNNALLSTSASGGADGTVQALLRACAGKYGQAQDALGAAKDSIAAQDYDFASVHVGAAAEYPQVCKALFRRQRPGQYPAEMAAREETLKQLCSVAQDIIALLSTNTPST